MSRLLRDLKEAHREELLLIPIAANMNLSSLDLILSGYEVDEFPAIIIDEDRIITEIVSLDELEKVIFQNEK